MHQDSGGKTLVSPTAFMRQLRPELYSDSKGRSAYDLDAPTFEYYLESITSRNQTHEFEIFCRKLCERTICPNLKPATGPEGGGDSKVDTETIPVSDEVEKLYFSSEPNAGKERWAFAFSAKKKWKEKARLDVASAMGTGRSYQRMFFVTSQFARGKDQSNLQDELTKQFNVQITILDRAWIVEQVIDHDHKDLAVNYLGVGKEALGKNHLGPEDYARAQHLDALEKQLQDPGGYQGMKMERVTDALVAAKLSRGLERPRVETDGRFARAIRLANEAGTTRQKIAAEYESLWTAYWWYDDATFVNEGYGAFEARVLDSDNATELGLLGNLLQLLFNSVRFEHLTAAEACLDERATRLSSRLKTLTTNTSRPNNALEARVSVLNIRVTQTVATGDMAALSTIWPLYSESIGKASGLGEFDAQRLSKTIEAFGLVAGDDKSYEQLVDDLAAFVSERTSGAQGALVLLRRAQQLDFDRNFEMIRLLGRAIPQLMKKECAESLIEAASLLALAYRSAGLLWAARANCQLALATIFIQAEEDSDLPANVVPTLMMLAWIAIELKHIPDVLDAIRLARGAAASLPLAEESKSHFEEWLKAFDMTTSSVLVGLEGDRLEAVAQIPDVLIRLNLPLSRMWLLYALGYEAELRKEGWISADDTAEAVADLAGRLAMKLPSAHRLRPVLLNGGDPSLHSTSVMGVQINVRHGGTDTSILAAELVLTSIEAAFATLPEREAVAHMERFDIQIIEDAHTASPTLAVDEDRHSVELRWPKGRNPADLVQQVNVQETIVRVITTALLSTCASHDMAITIRQLVEKDSMLDRILPLATNANSRQRVFKSAVPRIGDWGAIGEQRYTARQSRPDIKSVAQICKEDGQIDCVESVQNLGQLAINDHRKISIHSVIDSNLWDRASWAGTAFLTGPSGMPPVLALMFRDHDSARSIFEQWRSKVGEKDKYNTLYIGIVRGISEVNPAHYRLVLTSMPPDDEGADVGRTVAVATRSKIMEPDTEENLSRFLSAYRREDSYTLVPAILRDSNAPDFLMDLGILKQELIIRMEKDLDPNDFESALLMRSSRAAES